jgi:hypothetical protein
MSPRGRKRLAMPDRLVERPARVVAQVEHEALHPLRLQLLERVADFLVGGLGEVAQLDVAGLRVDHEHAAHGDDVHFVALDVHVDQLVVAGTADRDVDLGALWVPSAA